MAAKCDHAAEAIVKARAEEEKEEGIVKASCCGSDEHDVPYEKLCNSDDDLDGDPETFMARIVARWDAFIKEEEARFPGIKYRVYYPGEYTGDETSDSDIRSMMSRSTTAASLRRLGMVRCERDYYCSCNSSGMRFTNAIPVDD
jgi:hypothetical protein